MTTYLSCIIGVVAILAFVGLLLHALTRRSVILWMLNLPKTEEPGERQQAVLRRMHPARTKPLPPEPAEQDAREVVEAVRRWARGEE